MAHLVREFHDLTLQERENLDDFNRLHSSVDLPSASREARSCLYSRSVLRRETPNNGLEVGRRASQLFRAVSRIKRSRRDSSVFPRSWSPPDASMSPGENRFGNQCSAPIMLTSQSSSRIASSSVVSRWPGMSRGEAHTTDCPLHEARSRPTETPGCLESHLSLHIDTFLRLGTAALYRLVVALRR